MGYIEGIEEMKRFLTHNQLSYSRGMVMKHSNVSYIIDSKIKFTKFVQVLFDFNHTEFSRNISFLDNNTDSKKYYTEFTSKYQDYNFNDEDNNFIINSTVSNNKYGAIYQVVISI